MYYSTILFIAIHKLRADAMRSLIFAEMQYVHSPSGICAEWNGSAGGEVPRGLWRTIGDVTVRTIEPQRGTVRNINHCNICIVY